MPPLPIITSNYPPMTASASNPVEGSPGGVVKYSLTQRDQDTFYDAVGMSTRLEPDPTCQIAPYRINALQRYQFLPRGITADGTVTWDITGYAVERAGIYLDIWTLYNARHNMDPGFDPPLRVGQTVVIKAAQGGGPQPNAAAMDISPPTASGDPGAAESLIRAMETQRILTDASSHALFHPLLERHGIGAAIRNEIINAMNPAEDRELEERGSFELPLTALAGVPENLYERVRQYIQEEQDWFRRAGASFPTLDLTKVEHIRIILRATPNSAPSIGGPTEEGHYLQF